MAGEANRTLHGGLAGCRAAAEIHDSGVLFAANPTGIEPELLP